MFHFPAFPPNTLYIQVQVTRHHSGRVSPFGHPRITARLTAPRGISQPPTSFIGPWYQGIHHVPYITWPQRCSHPLYSSQTTTEKTPTTTHNKGRSHQCVPSDTQQRARQRKLRAAFPLNPRAPRTEEHMSSQPWTPHQHQSKPVSADVYCSLERR